MKFPVIGLIKNYHFDSLHNTVEPQILFNSSTQRGNICIRLASGDNEQTIESIKTIWEKVNKSVPFNYTFLDEYIDRWYASDHQVTQLVGIFTLLAIFIACLGLLGMTMYFVQSRTREIGIRKSVGASSVDIALMVVNDFIFLVGIAFIISWFVSYYSGMKWLGSFAYKTEIKFSLFFYAGIIAIGIAVITMSYHAMKAANTNPVNTLRYE